MTENSTPSGNGGGDQQSVFQEFVDAWIATQDAALVEAASLLALFHSADHALLRPLWQNPDDLAPLLEQLAASDLAEEEEGRYTLQPWLRDLLLQRWRTQDRARYRQLHARAAVLYQARLAQGESEWIEYVYHSLGGDDTAGVAVLRSAFAHAWQAQRLGLAEHLLRTASELTDLLGDEARAWLDYLHARLAMGRSRGAEAEQTLTDLLARPLPDALRAEVHAALGDLLVQAQRWRDALTHYQRAGVCFRELGEEARAVELLEAEAQTFVALASHLGGLAQEQPASPHPLRTGLAWLRHAPFLLYRWCSRRLRWLPNLYFGTDYQDWIILRLLYEAIHRLERVASYLRRQDPAAAATRHADVTIRLAELEHRVGRWAAASRRFDAARRSPVLQTDPYRRATLQQAEGQAALLRGRSDEAQTQLGAAGEIFADYGDRRALALVAQLRGDLAARARRPEEAIAHYRRSIEHAVAVDDLLGATQAWARLCALGQRDRSAEVVQQIEEIDRSLSRRAYLARFPGDLQRWFRRLALFVALPITYLFAWVLMVGIYVLLSLVEATALDLAQRIVPFIGPQVVDVAVAVIVLLGLILVLVWTYEFLYVTLGLLVVRLLPFRSLFRRQPWYMLLLPEGVLARDETGNVDEMAWTQIEEVVSVNRVAWRTPSALFSHFGIQGDGQRILAPGVVSNYECLWQDIGSQMTRAGHDYQERRLNTALFGDRVARATWLGVVLLALATLFDWVHGGAVPKALPVRVADGGVHSAYFASFVLYLWAWTLTLVPAVLLTHLAWNHLRQRRLLARGSWIGTLALTLLAFVFWLFTVLLFVYLNILAT